jgi:hypothetical protein
MHSENQQSKLRAVLDFRDIFAAAYSRIRPGREHVRVFNISYDHLHEMTDLWRNDEDDESTILALLDMIMSVVLHLDISKDMLDSLRVPLQIANDCADIIRLKYPESMNARPYLRWVLVKAAEFGCLGKRGLTDPFVELLQNVEDFPGKYFSYSDWIRTLIYVPRGIENPGWFMPQASTEANEPLLAALNSAALLQDYPTQALCYRLLILRSNQPQTLFQELEHLQGRVQGDREGCLRTRLTSYLVYKERAEQDSLLQKLRTIKEWEDHRIIRDPYLYWARDSIMRALTRRSRGPNITIPGPKVDTAYMEWLPKKVKAAIEEQYGVRTQATSWRRTAIDDHRPSGKPSRAPTSSRPATSVQIDSKHEQKTAVKSHEEMKHKSGSKPVVSKVNDRKSWQSHEPGAQEPEKTNVIRGATIEREVITHYRDIDHGMFLSPSLRIFRGWS